MDLWDLTRLLFRRWYIAVPMLLVSVATVIFAAQTVHPDYSSKGHILLIPAPGVSPDDKDAKSRPPNPWRNLGLDALGNATILKVTDQQSLMGLKAQGLTDSVTVLMDNRSPLLVIEAIGRNAKQATATVRKLQSEIVADVEAEQTRYGVVRQDMITTLALTDGSDVTVVTSKVKRVLIVAAGLGLLLTAGGTISVDAIMRRRNVRRGPREGAKGRAEATGGKAPPGDDEPENGQTMAIDLAVQPWRSPVSVEYRLSRKGARHATDAADSGERAGERVGTGERAGAQERSLEAMPDQTIILPLSVAPWSGRDDKSGTR
jgi:hypothetical protein